MTPEFQQCIAAIVEQFGAHRLDGERTVETRNRLGEATEGKQGITQARVRRNKLRIERQGAIKVADRRRKIHTLRFGHAEQAARIKVIGIAVENGFIFSGGLKKPSLP